MGVEGGQRLTDEQQAVVHHDPRRHATVLAVAGSGKTTTMVHRIAHLVREEKVPPPQVRALLFNRHAREDFERKLAEEGVEGVQVRTFHSLGHRLMRWAEDQGVLPSFTAMVDEGEVLSRVRKVVREHRRETAHGTDEPAEVDAEDVWTAIQAWKGMMTPPEEAAHRRFPEYVEIYRRFEALRLRERFRTYDDMIYEAVRLLETDAAVRSRLANRLEHLVVDEYQDVNHAQQRLTALLAGERARVMAVGDDDQCIYEWRGARPVFLRREFPEAFRHHPHTAWRLTRSFRFGPLIAQVAENVISRNRDRAEKTLVAADLAKPGAVVVDPEAGDGEYPPYREVVRLLRDEQVPPADVVVLVRKYAQSYDLQTRLAAAGIPFRVAGERAFVEHHPVRVLRHYLRLAAAHRRPLDEASAESLREVVNVPNRFVNRVPFETFLGASLAEGRTPAGCLLASGGLVDAGVNPRAVDRLRTLVALLRKVGGTRKRKAPAGDGRPRRSRGYRPLEILFREVDFDAHFREFQGPARAEASLAMQAAFSRLLAEAAVPLDGVDDFVRSFDTTQGRPPAECLLVTSVFRAKGLEWEHVVLPEVVEGDCPHLFGDETLVENRVHPARSLDRTDLLESERRLFYVALTRARSSVFVHSGGDEGSRPSRFLPECLVGPTLQAIPALVHVVRNRALPRGGRRTLLAAAAHAPLKSGMLKVLALALEEGGGDGTGAEVLRSLAGRLLAVPVRPPSPGLPGPSVPGAPAPRPRPARPPAEGRRP